MGMLDVRKGGIFLPFRDFYEQNANNDLYITYEQILLI